MGAGSAAGNKYLHWKCMINFYYFIKHSVSTLVYNIPDTRDCINFLKVSEMQYLGIISKWSIAATAAAKSLQLCPTLCNPTDGSPSGFPVPGILQARTLEWVAISFSNAWKWKVKAKSLSRVRLFANPWIAVYQAPSSMGFSRQEYWSGVPLPAPKVIYIYQASISLSLKETFSP